LLVLFCLLVGCANASTDQTAEPGASKEAGSEVVASLGGETITLEEVDDKARAMSLKPYQDLYNHRRQALEQIIADRLLAKEAEAVGMTPEDLMNQEVQSKAPPVTEEQVQNFYNQNQAQMGGRPLDENLSGQIRNYLMAQNLGQLQREFLDRLKSKSDLSVTLDPPRIDVLLAANDPAMGPADAPVTIVEYSDFQ
jgi:hypothetical protein